MGKMTQKIKEMQSKRIAYQTEKTKEYMARVASYLSLRIRRFSIVEMASLRYQNKNV